MKSPLAQRKISALDWFCLRAIAWYQRRISPRKGWRCAYARLHGGAGCSGFARQAIANYGLRAALPLVRARFDDCKNAGDILRAQIELDKPDDDETKKRRARRNNRFSRADWCDFLDCRILQVCDGRTWHCADALIDCGPGDVGCCDCSPCH